MKPKTIVLMLMVLTLGLVPLGVTPVSAAGLPATCLINSALLAENPELAIAMKSCVIAAEDLTASPQAIHEAALNEFTLAAVVEGLTVSPQAIHEAALNEFTLAAAVEGVPILAANPELALAKRYGIFKYVVLYPTSDFAFLQANPEIAWARLYASMH